MKRVKEARLVQIQLSGSNSENISCFIGLEANVALSCTIVNPQRRRGKLVFLYIHLYFSCSEA